MGIGSPFTATSDEGSALDGTQYLADGACTDAAKAPEAVVLDVVLDEQLWLLQAQAAAAHGVRASLSLPLRGSGGEPFGALNLYASEPDAFRGRRCSCGAGDEALAVGRQVGIGTALWLADVDVRYASTGRISHIHLLDAAVDLSWVADRPPLEGSPSEAS